jgi:hypothetical protein
MPQSVKTLRLVVSNSNAMRPTPRSSKSSPSPVVTWSLEAIRSKLMELQRLRPDHVGAVSLLLDDLLDVAHSDDGVVIDPPIAMEGKSGL